MNLIDTETGEWYNVQNFEELFDIVVKNKHHYLFYNDEWHSVNRHLDIKTFMNITESLPSQCETEKTIPCYISEGWGRERMFTVPADIRGILRACLEHRGEVFEFRFPDGWWFVYTFGKIGEQGDIIKEVLRRV